MQRFWKGCKNGFMLNLSSLKLPASELQEPGGIEVSESVLLHGFRLVLKGFVYFWLSP